MTKNDPLSKIAAKVRSSRTIVITCHLRPDGDSICTGLALAGMFEGLGKRVELVNRDPTPFPLVDLPAVRRIRVGQIPARAFDLAILLECANVSRSGQEGLDGYFKINIDHHYSNDVYADINWIDPAAAAVGEMAYTLAERLKLPVTPEIAGHLYCAIVSDTGCFQFSNTTARAFEVSHKLVTAGANPIKTSEFLFQTNTPAEDQAPRPGPVDAADERPRQHRRHHHVQKDAGRPRPQGGRHRGHHHPGPLHQGRRGGPVLQGDGAKDTFRVSVRSKDDANAATVAENFGGGGHVHAAGFTAVGAYASLIEDIPRQVEELIRRRPAAARRRRPVSSAA